MEPHCYAVLWVLRGWMQEKKRDWERRLASPAPFIAKALPSAPSTLQPSQYIDDFSQNICVSGRGQKFFWVGVGVGGEGECVG